MTRRISARRVFRLACFVWLALVLTGTIFRLPHLRPILRESTWELALGTLALLWVGGALWSGAVTLGYRGIGNRTVLRSDEPRAFWWHVAIGALCGGVLVGIGAIHLLVRRSR